MYETTRELVAAERRLGMDSWMTDVRPYDGEQHRPPDWTEDRGVACVPSSWAAESDLLVSHSGLEPGAGGDVPRVHVAHGRPRSSHLLGRLEGNHVYAAYAAYDRDPRWKAMVTLWPGYGRYWRLVFSRPVWEFPSFVDLDAWRPVPGGYGWGGKAGRPNVVVADIWRADRDPFHCVNAFALFAEAEPEARLHLYGIQPCDETALRPVLAALESRGNLGEVCGFRGDLARIYSAADMVITPHRMATRTVREAMACGCQVVAGQGNPHTPYTADDEDLDAYAAAMSRAWTDRQAHPDARRNDNRAWAEMNFDPAVAAAGFRELYGLVLGDGSGEPTVAEAAA